MGRLCSAVAVTAVALALGSSAGAESTKVKGSGDIAKMTADNAKGGVTVKLYGFDKPCQAHYIAIFVEWGNKAAYQADAGCYNAAPPKWLTSLSYLPDRNTREGKLVKCAKFRVTDTAKLNEYRVFVPRSCMGHAADRVRVRAEGDNYGSARPGVAGPTKLLRRG
jgi:hypothetical protein